MGEHAVGAGSAAVDPALRAIWADVLGVDELDVEDDFFALGGNSLLATQITARVADVLGVEVALDALFEAPTLGAYAEQVRAAAGVDAATPAAEQRNGGRPRGLRGLLRGRRGERTGQHGDGASEHALSHLQASAWSVQRYNPEVRPHVGQIFSLQGTLDVGALERAFSALVERHETLRTSYPVEHHRPRARVHPPEPVRIEVIGAGRRMREEELRAHVDAICEEPFDYTREPPLRVRLIRSARSAWVLVFVLHEIACDGQAYDLLVRELGQLYDAELAGVPSPLAAPAPRYRDVVRAQGPDLAPDPGGAGAAHWRRTLDGAPLSLPLPHERLVAHASEGGAYARRGIQLSEGLVARLRVLAQEEAATSFMLHLAALYALLHRWSGEQDLLVKAPAANRARVEREQIVGFFSMVLPVRVTLEDDPTFRELLRRTREASLGAFRHASHAPEDNMLREVAGMRGLTGFSALFRLWDPTTEQPLELSGVSARPYREDGEAGRLVLVVTERSDGRTTAQLSSGAPTLDARALGELLRHYERLLEQVAEDPDRRVGSGIELLTAAEREQLCGRARGADGALAADGLHGLVAASAARAPAAVAFDPGGGAEPLTYAALEARAVGVARALRERGVRAGEVVGLELAPGGELLVGLLGAWRAGAAAAPLRDPGGADADPPPPLATTLDAQALAAIGAAADDEAQADPAAVALVVRTAGVGGRPRWVQLTHATLARAALRAREAQRLTPADRVAHVPGAGAWSWALAPWAALAAGATVVGPERAPQGRGASSPSGWLEATGATVAAMDPWLASAALARPLPPALRLLCAQGAGPLAAPAEARARRAVALQRAYGVTEAGGLVLAEHGAAGSTSADAPLVGEAAGLRARVLDRHGNVAPAGVLGELELDDGAGPIRTGDLARRRADGALELAGRMRDELRWRGVRLRPILCDLDAALAAHPGVQAAAACWEPAREALVACVVARRAEPPARAELDEWLQRTMADWILPALYVALDAIPLRPDGLPDRDALAAAPAVVAALAAESAAAPESATERRLAGLWEQVLGVRRAGAHDNFFAAGGKLVDGIALASRAREAGIAIDPGDVMYRPTIAELAAIAEARGD